MRIMIPADETLNTYIHIDEKILDLSVSLIEITLSNSSTSNPMHRIVYALRRNNNRTIRGVLSLTPREILSLRNVGKSSYVILIEALLKIEENPEIILNDKRVIEVLMNAEEDTDSYFKGKQRENAKVIKSKYDQEEILSQLRKMGMVE